MKLSNNYRIGLLVAFLFLAAFTTAEAAHYQTETQTKTNFRTVLKQKKAAAKMTIFKVIPKKIKKSNDDDESILNGGVIALAIGIASFLLLILAVAAIAASGGTGFLFLLAALAAIAGDIFAIRTLRKIGNSDDPENYRGSRRMAIIGLVLSLLTGLIPLALLVLILLTL
jgi:hypothetical protein